MDSVGQVSSETQGGHYKVPKSTMRFLVEPPLPSLYQAAGVIEETLPLQQCGQQLRGTPSLEVGRHCEERDKGTRSEIHSLSAAAGGCRQWQLGSRDTLLRATYTRAMLDVFKPMPHLSAIRAGHHAASHLTTSSVTLTRHRVRAAPHFPAIPATLTRHRVRAGHHAAEQRDMDPGPPVVSETEAVQQDGDGHERRDGNDCECKGER